MNQNRLELSDFTEPFGPRYSCALTYTEADGWIGQCTGPRGFCCTVTGAGAESCCTVALERVVEHHGSVECELSYAYSEEAWAKACAEDADSAEAEACPLCNSEHPEHEHAVRRASARFN